MDELYNVRAAAHGFDLELIECVGGRTLLEIENSELCSDVMDESAAKIQAKAVKISEPMKSAKQNMKDAKQAAKAKDFDKAKSHYKVAISDLKKVKAEAEKIEDDHALSVFLSSFLRYMVSSIGLTLIAMVGVFGAVFTGGTSAVATAVSAGALVTRLGSFVFGVGKPVKFAVDVVRGKGKFNKQGNNGESNPKKWYKVGMTRNEVMSSLDRLIKTAEDGIDAVEKAKQNAKE